MIELRTWLYSDVAWGSTLCEARCGRPADGLLDGVPLCPDCAEQLMQRELAVEMLPALREQLGDLFDE